MSLSLKSKLILAFSFVVIVSISSIILYANLDAERQVQNYMMRGGMYGLTNLVDRLEKYYEEKGSWDGINRAIDLGQMMMNRGGSRGSSNNIALVDINLRVIHSSMPVYQVGNILKSADVKNAIVLKNSFGNIIGYLIVENASNVTVNDISPFITRLRGIIAIVGLLAAGVAVVMGILISNHLTKPVKALTIASNKLSAGDFSTRVTVNGNDELAVLGRTFNQMAANLENVEERKKAMTADIAHELRTPLAVQKAQVEAMMDGVIPLDKRNLETVANQSEFLSRLVEDLRLLAMADAGELNLERQDIKIDNLIRKVIEQFKGQVQKDGTVINYSVSKDMTEKTVNADPDRLMQILHNLIANALNYGRKGGQIGIALSGDLNRIFVSVKDDGPGIPEEALTHLFERFYRYDRSRSHANGSTGLGLAISKKLAVLMDGDLSAANDPLGGAVFTFTLPAKTS